MHMDNSAIKQIQQAQTTDAIQAAIGLLNTSEPMVAVPNDFAIKSLEQHMPNRSRFRGSFETNTMGAFSDYTKEHKQGCASCFVNGDSMKAKVIFDIGDKDTAGHCDHTALIQAIKLCDYSALLRINGDTLNQKELAEWVEDWADNITMIDKAGGEIDTGLAVAAIRTLTITSKQESSHVEETLRSNRSVMEEIEADGGDSLPHAISFRCKPYECIDFRNFVIRVSVLKSHEKPRFSLRVIQLELHQEQMANEFSELVKTSLEGTDIKTYMGSFLS